MPFSLSTCLLLPTPLLKPPTTTTTLSLRPSSHFLTIKASANNNNNNNNKPNSWVSPDWLTSLTRSLTITKDDDSGIPVANAKLDDVSELLGGALFLPLFKWMNEYGPIYRLAAGPRNFVVVSDPAIAKHVLRNYGKYGKGLVAEVSEFLFGSGFAIAEGPLWTVIIQSIVWVIACVVGWFFGFWEELIYFDAYAGYEWESFCNAVCLLVQCGWFGVVVLVHHFKLVSMIVVLPLNFFDLADVWLLMWKLITNYLFKFQWVLAKTEKEEKMLQKGLNRPSFLSFQCFVLFAYRTHGYWYNKLMLSQVEILEFWNMC